MSLSRATLFVVSTVFGAGMASTAFAGCCGWGRPALVAPPPAFYEATGCGGCGVGVSAHAAMPQIPPALPAGAGWGSGCGCASAVAYAAAPASLYVVNQGPDFTGPGLMVPFRTYTPAAAFIGATNYPYIPGPRYGHSYGYGVQPYRSVHRSDYHSYREPRLAYRAHRFVHPYHDGLMRHWR